MAKKSRVPKTRNAGTMTESAFWGFIRSALRAKSMYWKPIQKCREKAKRAYKGPNKRRKWEYQCNICKNWFDSKNVVVDHIIPAGSLTGPHNVGTFIEKLFCEEDGLQCLCKPCHDVKTLEDNKNTKANAIDKK